MRGLTRGGNLCRVNVSTVLGKHTPDDPCPTCNKIGSNPENVEPLCEVCNDTGFVDDLDNDGASVRCEWCPTPENVEEPT